MPRFQRLYAVTPRGVQLHAGDLRTFVHGMHLGCCVKDFDLWLTSLSIEFIVKNEKCVT